ncbi:MAG: beta-1,3-glucanase family protein [Bacteroidota bacterium]
MSAKTASKSSNAISVANYVQFKLVNDSNVSTLNDPYISLFAKVNGVYGNFYVDQAGIATFNNSSKGQGVFKLSYLKNAANVIYIDANLDASSGRIYFSTDSAMVTSGTEPDVATADFYFDWVEFAVVGSSKKLVANTTQVDQFGFPIQLKISPPDANFGAIAGSVSSGVSRNSIIQKFSNSLSSEYKDCLYPVSGSTTEYYRIMSPNQAIVKKPASKLTQKFNQVIDDFFTHYSSHELYLNSDSAYPYVGKVTTVSAKDKSGASHKYPVLQFKFADQAPINPGIPVTPPSGTGPYNIYYPFFKTNNTPSTHTSYDGKPLLPPPAWWYDTISGKGTLTPTESPSQMVFAGNGIFADTFWQLGQTGVTSQTDLLGNLENQINVALNRGHAQTWFTLVGSIAAGKKDPTTGHYKTTLTLSSTTYQQQDKPNTTINVTKGMQVISYAAAIPLTVSKVIDSTTLELTSPVPILAYNSLYVTFANFYPSGDTWNEYGQFFHQDTISIGGRAYALSFDDQGGFSSTLTSLWSNAPSTLEITLVYW